MNFRAAVQIQLSVNDGPKFRFSRHFLAFAGAAGIPAAISRSIFRRICFEERFVLGGSEMPSHTLIGGRIVRRTRRRLSNCVIRDNIASTDSSGDTDVMLVHSQRLLQREAKHRHQENSHDFLSVLRH